MSGKPTVATVPPRATVRPAAISMSPASLRTCALFLLFSYNG
jgi:hypothetical protein